MGGRGEAAGVRVGPSLRATQREISVVTAVLEAGSEKAAAHRLGLSHSTVKHHLANARSKVGAETTAQLVWILAPRLPESEDGVQTPLEGGCPEPEGPTTRWARRCFDGALPRAEPRRPGAAERPGPSIGAGRRLRPTAAR